MLARDGSSAFGQPHPVLFATIRSQRWKDVGLRNRSREAHASPAAWTGRCIVGLFAIHQIRMDRLGCGGRVFVISQFFADGRGRIPDLIDCSLQFFPTNSEVFNPMLNLHCAIHVDVIAQRRCFIHMTTCPGKQPFREARISTRRGLLSCRPGRQLRVPHNDSDDVR